MIFHEMAQTAVRHKTDYKLFAHFYTVLVILYTTPFSLVTREDFSCITLCTSCGMKVLFTNHFVLSVVTCISQLFNRTLVDVSQRILNGSLHFTQSASNGLSQTQWAHFTAELSCVLCCTSWRTCVWQTAPDSCSLSEIIPQSYLEPPVRISNVSTSSMNIYSTHTATQQQSANALHN